MKIQTRAALIDWIYKALGSPAVRPPITEEQINNIIDDAIDYYTLHAGGTGHEEDYVLIETKPVEYTQITEDNKLVFQTKEYEDTSHLCKDEQTVPFLVYKQEYQLPKNVVAVGDIMSVFRSGIGYVTEPILERAFNLTSLGLTATGIAGLQGAGYGVTGTSLWTPGSFGLFNSFGSRGGEGTRGAGGGADLIGYELGLQYLELIRQRYTIKMDVQFLEESKKIRLSPAPKAQGFVLLPVWVRTADEHLYGNIWIRRYIAALCKIQCGYNVSKYTGITFVGGATVNGEFYIREGKEEKEKLEEELKNNAYNYPPRFYFA
ncbi:MAG: hypothetical protein NZZ41_01145 [Candidatus Dojkabacteria bacterium]|nr:hypothetical protein [Candidatus Dojkabacteria bacterium]